MTQPGSPRRLAAAPRLVPWSIQARELFAGPEAAVGWLFLVFGLSLAVVFAPKMDLASWYWYRGPLQHAPARVENCWQEGTVNAQEFSFMRAGLNYRGVSYGSSPCLLAGQPIEAEFPPDRPDLARLPGSRRGLFGPSAALLFLMPLLGLGIVVLAFARGLDAVGLLSRGLMAQGRLSSKKPTWKRAAGRRVCAATYRLEDGQGTPRDVCLEILGDELPLGSEEWFLYDPARPDAAKPADEILERLPLTEAGEIAPAGAAQALLAAALPAATVGFSAWLLLRQLLGR